MKNNPEYIKGLTMYAYKIDKNSFLIGTIFLSHVPEHEIESYESSKN